MPTDLTHVLLRRWYLVLTGLLVTIGLIGAVLVLLPLKYNARADVVLWTTPAGRADNPLLDLGGLQTVPAILTRGIPSTADADTLAGEGVTSGYSVTTDPTTSAPLLIVQATGTNPQAASRALRLVVRLIPHALDQIQRDVPTRALITYKVLQYHQPTAITRTRTRILLATTAAGLVLTGLLATAADRLILYRRRKNKPNTDTDTDTDTGDEDRPSGEAAGGLNGSSGPVGQRGGLVSLTERDHPNVPYDDAVPVAADHKRRREPAQARK